MEQTEGVLEEQRHFFKSGITKSIDFRIASLNKLYRMIEEHEDDILEALHTDLNKHGFEAYASEIGLVLEEITFMVKNIESFFKPEKAKTPLSQFPAKGKIYKEPYGQVLIIAPWNYPFLLTVLPLVGALAAGNTAVIKPSEFSPATSALLKKMLESTFDTGYIQVVEGAVEVNQSLLSKDFDFILFTGSTEVGKIVMRKAAENLTPVVLELGGKSPAIVDETADIELAGKRIAWGKAINAGQTCVAPDYILVQEDVKQELINEIKASFEAFYSKHAELNEDYPKIINEKHFNRLSDLIDTGDVIYGGDTNEDTHQINLTLMDNVSFEDPVMQEEIFGPILPILTYTDLEDAVDSINARPKPLALYLFTTTDEAEHKVLNDISFGGGAINDTVTHLASPYMGFGGVGQSGMGSYRGFDSLETFSHSKSILKKSNRVDTPFRYPPYKESTTILKGVMK